MTPVPLAYVCTFCSAVFRSGAGMPDRTEERCPSCETGHLIWTRITEDILRRMETAL